MTEKRTTLRLRDERPSLPRCHPRSAVAALIDRRAGIAAADRRCPLSLAPCAGAYLTSATSIDRGCPACGPEAPGSIRRRCRPGSHRPPGLWIGSRRVLVPFTALSSRCGAESRRAVVRASSAGADGVSGGDVAGRADGTTAGGQHRAAGHRIHVHARLDVLEPAGEIAVDDEGRRVPDLDHPADDVGDRGVCQRQHGAAIVKAAAGTDAGRCMEPTEDRVRADLRLETVRDGGDPPGSRPPRAGRPSGEQLVTGEREFGHPHHGPVDQALQDHVVQHERGRLVEQVGQSAGGELEPP